eukprot:UN03294
MYLTTVRASLRSRNRASGEVSIQKASKLSSNFKSNINMSVSALPRAPRSLLFISYRGKCQTFYLDLRWRRGFRA